MLRYEYDIFQLGVYDCLSRIYKNIFTEIFLFPFKLNEVT